MAPQEKLADFLARTFAVSGLKRIAVSLGDGRLGREIDWRKSTADVASQVAEKLFSRSLVDSRLRQRLEAEQPGLQGEIRSLWEEWDQPPRSESGWFEGPAQAPALEVPCFQDLALFELHEALSSDAEAVCLVAPGLGGIGKTTLARQYVATGAREIFAEGAAWLDGADLAAELGRVAERFGLTHGREQPTAKAATFLRRELYGRAVLLVIDNVDPQRTDLSDLPIVGGSSRTLIISRTVTIHQDIGAPAARIILHRWPLDRCREYLREADPALDQVADEELDALSEHAGRLPLAIRLASRLLGQAAAPAPAALLTQLAETPVAALDEVAQGLDSGLAAIVLAAYEGLDETARKALLALAACSRATQAEVVGAVAELDEATVEAALGELVDNLVEHAAGSQRPWGLHELVRQLLREQDGFSELERTHSAWVMVQLSRRTEEKLDSYLPEALWSLERLLSEGQGTGASYLLRKLTPHMFRRGRYAEYEGPARRLLGLLEPGSREAAVHADNLGICYKKLGNIPEAVGLLERALAIYERLGSLEERAANRGNLGACYRRLGNIPRAIKHHAHALAVDEELGRLEEQAFRLCELSSCYLALGNIPRAIGLLERSLGLLRQLGLPEDHPQVAIVREVREEVRMLAPEIWRWLLSM